MKTVPKAEVFLRLLEVGLAKSKFSRQSVSFRVPSRNDYISGAVLDSPTVENVQEKWDQICDLETPVAVDNVQERFMHVLAALQSK